MQPVKDARGPRAAPIMTAAPSPSETCGAAASMIPCRSPQHRLGAIRVRASRQHLYDRPRVKAAAPLFHGAWPRGSTQNSCSPRRPSRPTPHGLWPLRGPAFPGRRGIGIARHCDSARSIKCRSGGANFEQSPADSRNTFRRCSLASLRPLPRGGRRRTPSAPRSASTSRSRRPRAPFGCTPRCRSRAPPPHS